jgi:DNA-binding LacI/PurR family transcriptional regulator
MRMAAREKTRKTVKRPDKAAAPKGTTATAAAPGRRNPTIKDVAAAAGVSPMTVSNVINGNLRFFSEDTRRRVEDAVAGLGYRPLGSGRSLKSGRRNVVGVVIVDELQDFMSNPFMSRFVSGLCGHLSENGYMMILQGIHPDEFARSFPLRRAEADAYCMRLHGNDSVRASMLEVLERIDEPVILIQETLKTGRPDTCVVRQDDYGGGTLLAEHLIVRGVRHIAVLEPAFAGPMTMARTRGLRAGFEEAKVPVRIDSITSRINDFISAYDAVMGYLKSGPLPQAVLGTNDELALAALRALQDLQIDVPGKVRVVGFNGFQPPGYTRPSLSTIVSAANSIGVEAGRAMLARLQSGIFAQTEIVLPVAFRKGGST